MKDGVISKPKVIVIGGPTATGKSDVAVELALQHNGEIISADSRQVYAGLDIGSAKITNKEMKSVPHHMLDVSNLDQNYSAGQYQQEAQKVLGDILSREKTPIICGGTGFYIDSLIYKQSFPDVPIDAQGRKKREQEKTKALYTEIKERDPQRAKSIDPHNKVRLIRALEIIDALGFVPEQQEKNSPYSILYICLELEKEKHQEIIEQRIIKRMDNGMLQEVEGLHKQGASWQRLEDLGLEYRYLAQLLQKKISEEEAIETLIRETNKFVKRQYTWFRKNKDVLWVNTVKDKGTLVQSVEKFLNP